MDCVAVYENGRFAVKEFRHLKKGDPVVVNRTEDASEGIYVHADGFRETVGGREVFAFRQYRSRETGFSRVFGEI